MDPGADYKPFRVFEKEWQTIPILWLCGTEEQHAEVKADRVHIIMDAIAQGWDIDIRYADIEGNLDLGMIAEKLDKTEDGELVIKANIRMISCNISRDVCFGDAQFGGNVDFSSSQFSGIAIFGSAHFSGNTYFESAHFSGNASFLYAHFSGGARFQSAHFSRNAYFWSAKFSEHARFGSAQFIGDAYFWSVQFIGDARFRSAHFIGDAYFGSAHFIGDAYFRSAHFSGDTHFGSAHFTGDANFENAVMARPADFANITHCENHVFKGLWNATLGRIERFHWQTTGFSGFNTEKVMDGASNPWLKRCIDDELWIQSWRRRSWWREPLFTIWELTSHCGRSIGLWAFWSVLIAVVFGFIYQGLGSENIAFNVDQLRDSQPDSWDYLYYSVVTFTTLGFGDIVPLTKPARLAVGAEVVLGYVMLGGLISIFANKLARRS